MKTSMHLTRLSFILLLIAALNACKKSDDNNPDGGDGAGSYTYSGNTTATTRGDYLYTNGNAYLYVYGKSATDIVQFIFYRSAVIKEGTFVYQTIISPMYNPATNFSGGSVTSASKPGGDGIIGGKVTITKADAGYAVSFDCTTADGSTVKGTYTGTFTGR